MKREELRQEFEIACEIKWENSQGEPDIDYVMWLEDKITATQPSLPPAEGAEEILNKAKAGGVPLTWLITPGYPAWNAILEAMHEFAALHAQRIADKMVSERLREELGLYNDWLNGAAGKYLTSPYIDEYLTSEYYLKTREK